MIGFFTRYLRPKGNKEQFNTNIKQLEELTDKIIQSNDTPTTSLFELMTEFNNGIIGFDSEGVITFCNYHFAKETKISSSRCGSVYDLMSEESVARLKGEMKSSVLKSSFKIEIKNGEVDRFVDVVLWKIQNGKSLFIMFFVDCLENSLFDRKNCPIKDSCPYGEKCRQMFDTKY